MVWSYSVKKELSTGSYYYLNRDSAKSFSGNIEGESVIVDNFSDFARETLGKPFACLVLEEMDLNEKTALYAYMPNMPEISYTTKTNSHKSASFTIKEVL